ncbi:MAG: UDP-N-acetylmuramoyl-L-alanyl-D-glutamate--2,6-diaminopimelate ligase [Lentisphaerae bacterium RIFOXYC12_FULL_60_16]|nr:MAG: UDP-N-acetylmuramoyl-L-alanyl-D-glutamate--2,6-diaminopimelate ligase [Lentisphaerae bacterium RIFOXYC12_FULL_60_16]
MDRLVRLDALLRDVPGAASSGGRNPEVTGVVGDSRQVRPGSVFVVIRGGATDGVRFVDDACQRGAVAIVSESPLPELRKDMVAVAVTDARRSLGLLSAAFHQHPSNRLRMTGITGTNGKTTTAYLMREMLRSQGRATGVVSTIEYEIGARSIPATRTTPDAPQLQSLLASMVSNGCQDAVMEVSSHALVQQRVAGVEFDAAIFTNLTRDHLDYHGSADAYFDAKALLFKSLGSGRKSAIAVIHADDPCGGKMAGLTTGAEVITYGVSASAMVRAADIHPGPDGTTFRLETPWGAGEVRTGLMGRFNVQNILAAVACAVRLGVSLDTAVVAAGRMPPVPGRLQKVPSRKGFRVFVDYAHTDDALEQVLTTLREITGGRLMVVFGCGGNRDTGKRPAMGAVASRLADYSIVTSDNPRKEDPMRIIADILQGFGANRAVEVEPDRGEAIRKAIARALPGDIVLVAGKGHETFQDFGNMTVPFDDREVASRYL